MKKKKRTQSVRTLPFFSRNTASSEMGFSSGHLIFLGGSLHQERESPWAITHTEAVPEEFKSFQLIGQNFLSEDGNTVSLSELDCKTVVFF